MWNRTRILGLGLGFALLFQQIAYADTIIPPLNPDGSAQPQVTQTQAAQSQAPQMTETGADVALEGPGADNLSGGTAQTVEPGRETQGNQPVQPGRETQGNQPVQPGDPYATGGPGTEGGTKSEPTAGAVPGGQGTAAQPGETQANAPQTGAGVLSGAFYSTKEPVNVASGAPDAAGTAQVAAPEISAQGAILYDVTHDRFLFEKNADTRFYPASITKLMTALLVLENCNLNETVTFSKTAVTNLESGAVTLKLAEGDRVSLKDCMYGLLLKSANEVANGLAEHVAGSIPKFADMMNAKAKALGCTDTHFVNPNGLNDPNHYTTCRDMARIAKAAFENPTLCQIDKTMSYQFPATKNAPQARTLTPGHKMFYPNDSRYYTGIVGGKTGYTSLAGNTLVTCVERNGVRLIAVVLKARSTQYTDTKALLDYGFGIGQSADANSTAGQAKYNRWLHDGDTWQFELADGSSVKNACVTVDGEDYVFDANGKMLTGWQYLNGGWYCLKENGAMAKRRWMQDQDKWFYLGSDGKMVTNTVIDGQYRVGSDGVWVQ